MVIPSFLVKQNSWWRKGKRILQYGSKVVSSHLNLTCFSVNKIGTCLRLHVLKPIYAPYAIQLPIGFDKHTCFLQFACGNLCPLVVKPVKFTNFSGFSFEIYIYYTNRNIRYITLKALKNQLPAGAKTEERAGKCSKIQKSGFCFSQDGSTESCTTSIDGERKEQKSFLCYAYLFAN